MREGNVFSLSTTGEGVPQSQVPSKVTGPRPFPGGTPVPGSFQGFWSQVLSGGTPIPAEGTPVLPGGVPQSWPGGTTVLTGGTPVLAGGTPGQEYPLVRTGLEYPQDRLCSGRYALCGFPQEAFLVMIMFEFYISLLLMHSNQIVLF